MRREYLVGVISTTMRLEGADYSGPWLFTKFLGEGAEGIVYEVAPLGGPAREPTALKLVKGLPMFEMQTLHHSLRVHEERYPDHPLRMSAEARLELLTREMLTMIDNPHLMLRVRFYRDLLSYIFLGLVRAADHKADQGEPIAPLLEDPAFREWTDDNLVQDLEDDLDDERIVEEYRPLIEELVADIEAAVARWQADGSFAPFSRNPIFNLLGLYLEDFINEPELRHITDSDDFGERLSLEHVLGILRLVRTLYLRLTGGGADKSRRQLTGDDRKTMRFAVVACHLLAQITGGRLLGMVRLWESRLLLLDEGTHFDVVEPVLQSALGDLQEESAAAQRSDTLLLLADLYQDRDPERAAEYRNQLQQIRRS
jgi:hypothetical protein